MQPENEHYPSPAVPPLPVLSFDLSREGREPKIASGLSQTRCEYLTSARMAIYAGLNAIGVGFGHTVLVPAYNCPALVAPIRQAGANVVYYQINQDLSVDVDSILENLGPSVKALLVVHYFGFPQDLLFLRDLCDSNSIALIEDCAHAPFGETNGIPLGSVGDFSVFSLMKFFPVIDGGALRVSGRGELPKVRSAGLIFELKMAVNNFERSLLYCRLRAINWILKFLVKLTGVMAKLANSRHSPTDETRRRPAASDGGFAFDAAWKDVRMSWFSRFVISTTSISRLVRKRRDNFTWLSERISKLHGVELVFPKLPQGVVPFAVPVLLEDIERLFPALKHARLPMYRWEDIETGYCTVSDDYSKRLIQLPCHQDLKRNEIEWMTETLEAIVAGGVGKCGADL